MPILVTVRYIVFFACFSLLLNGCVAQKSSVQPYEARQQREAALQNAGLEQQYRIKTKQQNEETASAEKIKDVLMPTMKLINDRIYEYEQKLDALNALKSSLSEKDVSQDTLDQLDSCGRSLKDILVEYNALNQRLLQKTELEAAQLIAGESLLRISERDIAFLESDCKSLMVSPSEMTPQGMSQPVLRNLHREEIQLKESFAAGDYELVVTSYQDLPLDDGQKPSFDATYLYGQALLKTRQENKAREVFIELLETIRRQDQALWEFRLEQLIGDLEFGLGSYVQARERYREIQKTYKDLESKNNWAEQQLNALELSSRQSDEVSDYAALLKNFLAYNPERDGYVVVQQAQSYLEKHPYSPVASSADQLLAMAQLEADKWLNQVLKKADSLAKQGKYQESQLLLERVPRNIIPPDKQESIRRKSEQLITAESIAVETSRLVEEQELQEQWNDAMGLLETRNYDQAIEKFTALRTTSYGEKATAKVDEAAKLAAEADRRRASDLFVRAKRTNDVESKKKLLFTSRKLLQDILIKYPQAGLSDKVKRHLQSVEQEIQSIDPTLLNMPTTVGGDIYLDNEVQKQPVAADESPLSGE
ncbi:hypothetical protein [Desulfogranum japonicum]|uniref:hypothetical protein n=1 Tax=Desulfogranum japonicum TaxID=231447 RepID=UPI0003F91624|nr:hypothetical protein [Desulfogranum japonicum]